MRLKQVISGAQIGADIAGLRAARACGIPTGGFMPAGRRTRNGPLPMEDFNAFGLVETDSSGYPIRTEKNVRVADATVAFAHNWDSPGEKLTRRMTLKHKKPSFGVHLVWLKGKWRVECGAPWNALTFSEELYRAGLGFYARHVAEWIRMAEVEILNVAGNSDESIEGCVEHFLTMTFTELRDMSQGEEDDD